MKKLLITISILWMSITLFTPLILAPVTRSELLRVAQKYSEVDILDYQQGYFSSKVRMKISIPQLGLTHESDEKIIHSPLLFGGLNWLKINGKDIKAQLNLIGNIYAQMGALGWKSNIFSQEKGQLTINKLTIPIENGSVQLNYLSKTEVFLKEKKVLIPEFSGKLTYNKRTYLFFTKSFFIQQNGENIYFEAQEINVNLGFGEAQKMLKIKGKANLQKQKLESHFVTKLTFPLLELNKKSTFLKIKNNILEINNEDNLSITTNLAEKKGYIILKSQFAQKNGLLLLLKYKFGELPQTESGDYWLPFYWDGKGFSIDEKFI